MIEPKNTPATVAHFDEFKREIYSKFDALILTIKELNQRKHLPTKYVDSNIKQIDPWFEKIDARFNKVNSRFDKIDTGFEEFHIRFDKIDRTLEKMLDQMQQHSIRIEEQFSKDNIALERLKVQLEKWATIKKTLE